MHFLKREKKSILPILKVFHLKQAAKIPILKKTVQYALASSSLMNN